MKPKKGDGCVVLVDKGAVYVTLVRINSKGVKFFRTPFRIPLYPEFAKEFALSLGPLLGFNNEKMIDLDGGIKGYFGWLITFG